MALTKCSASATTRRLSRWRSPKRRFRSRRRNSLRTRVFGRYFGIDGEYSVAVFTAKIHNFVGTVRNAEISVVVTDFYYRGFESEGGTPRNACKWGFSWGCASKIGVFRVG